MVQRAKTTNKQNPNARQRTKQGSTIYNNIKQQESNTTPNNNNEHHKTKHKIGEVPLTRIKQNFKLQGVEQGRGRATTLSKAMKQMTSFNLFNDDFTPSLETRKQFFPKSHPAWTSFQFLKKYSSMYSFVILKHGKHLPF